MQCWFCPRGSDNAFNRDTILAQSNIYANWQDAQIIVQGRIAKISAQFDFGYRGGGSLF